MQLYYPPGGAPTTRADGLESNENHSLLSGGRYDRTFWKPMHLKGIPRLDAVISKEGMVQCKAVH
mgnify:CR=1 FL=1